VAAVEVEEEQNLLVEMAEQLEVETVHLEKLGFVNLFEEHHSFYRISNPH